MERVPLKGEDSKRFFADEKQSRLLDYELLGDRGLMIVLPAFPLQTGDFEAINRETDIHTGAGEDFNKLMICSESFPGWDDFRALLSHIQYVGKHHQSFHKVAVVTDRRFLSVLPQVASYFFHADVKHFDYREKESALAWLNATR